MKVTDARQKILMRRKYHSSRQQPKDARQIIEQKRKLKKLEMNKLKQASHTNDHVQRSQFTGKQGLRKTVKNSLSNVSKSVSLRDGMITVTARQSPKKSSKFPPSGKQIIANNGEITVVKINTGSLGERRPETSRNRHEEDMDIEMAEIAGSSSSTWELQSPLHLKSMSATTSDLRSSITTRHHHHQPIPTAIPSYVDNAHPLQQGSFSTAHLPPSSSVLVTNLHPSVSEDDILELFSDIGAIRSTRFLQPGTAIVYYLRKADAEKACLAYHNRLLDGLPMQCTILPESTTADKISVHKSDQRMSAATPLQPPPPGLAFSSGRTSHRPVKFTVRLP